jgi:hypothetical protein
LQHLHHVPHSLAEQYPCLLSSVKSILYCLKKSGAFAPSQRAEVDGDRVLHQG